MLGEGPQVLGPRLRAPLLWGSEVLERASREVGLGDAWRRVVRRGSCSLSLSRREILTARSAAGSLGVFCSLAAQTPGSGIWHQYRPSLKIVTIVSALILTQAMGRTAAQLMRGERAFGLEVSLLLPGPTGHLLTNVIPNRGSLNHQKRCLR